ncbi:MAG: hypothetical protein EOP45_02375 [Sphingobacteriaceae bacterium]|nr:MAG: hypothetical protein EOP45_02375 [Sphingobacteriaceae bacterium]
MNTSIEIPAKLIEAIKTKKLLVFAGAGLSRNLGLPDWDNMVINIIKATGIPKYQGYVQVLEDKLFDSLSVLDRIKGEKTTAFKYIEENFNVSRDKNTKTHKKLIQLSGKIVTTNYDNAFERAKDNIYNTSHDSTFKISNIANKNEYVFHIHGSASIDPSKCIIFSEDYEKLYSGDSAAIFKIRELFINNTILFIGFSFADPFVNQIFSAMDSLFEGNHTHYILTTTPDKFSSLKYIRPIELQNYSQLEEFIDLCLPFTENPIEPKIEIKQSNTHSLTDNNLPKIIILYPACIDLPELKQSKTLLTCFESLEAEIYKGFLNMKTLQDLEDFSIVFIITSSYKGKVYIEGEDLKSQLISIEDLISAIPNDAMPKVVITDSSIDVSNIDNTACISTFKNEVLNKFIYKILKNNEDKFIHENVELGNFKNETRYVKSKSSIQALYKGVNKVNFSAKSTDDLVGRIEEQAIITRKLISIAETKKILTIKGAGGTGKTSLIKKSSHALYSRGYFTDGVVFTSCEQIKTFKEFEEVLTNAFKLNNISDFEFFLNENSYRLNLLIILDNFETVTSLGDKSQLGEIYKLLDFVTDFASIAITSREVMDQDFEEVYTLSSMITDDAVILFKQNYGDIIESELNILRHDILENILNNNPLAIKIVTRSSIKQKSIVYIKEQLQDSFFESTSLNIENIFNKKADVNIERTKSIFQSINYSYCKLTTKEKLAFELLHLFPDGISIADFKAWFNKESTSGKISDSDLKSLNNKSLIENNDGILQLQPIVRRFAEFQFNRKNEDIKNLYYSDAYSFNAYVLKYLDEVHFKSTNMSLKLHNIFKNNLLLVLEYIPNIDISEKADVIKQHLLNYTVSLMDYLMHGQQTRILMEKISPLYGYFSDVEYSNELLNVSSLSMLYYSENFDDTYQQLLRIFTPEQMENRTMNTEHKNEYAYKNSASNIHSMEGYTMQYINSFIKNRSELKDTLLDSHLFYLGIHAHTKELTNDFHTFQREYVYNKVSIEKLESYINSLFKEYHLERMQSTYVLSKIKPLHYTDIKKLVVTNPYTEGLKELMLAFNSEDKKIKNEHFLKSLKKLNHIKYYYLEALYYYCKFLYKHDIIKFEQHYSEGLKLCKKFYYQYLEFRFNSIISEEKLDYKCNFSYYPVDGISEFVNSYIELYNKSTSQRIKTR